MKKEIPVEGMSCAACAISVENTLRNSPGVKNASVNYANHAATIEWEEQTISLNELQKKIQATGYDLLIEEIEQAELEEKAKDAFKKLKLKTIFAGILALPVFVIGMFWMDMPYGNYIMWVFTTPILFVFGNQFFKNAWKQTKNLSANMDTLVAISTGIAYLYSSFNTFFPTFLEAKGLEPHVYFEAAAVILFFILLGKTLEAGAKAGTGEALKKLMGLQPTDLIVLQNGKELTKKTIDVQLGELILIKPGQKIPLDGKTVEGESYVNENMLTGEPIPVLKSIQSKVFAGTINQAGSFVFEVEKISKNTLLSQIIDRVKAAQGSKAPVQKLVDKVAAVFVPVVLLIGLLTMLVWGFSGVDEAWLRGIMAMITVFVIACPCALGLATPTAIITAIGKGADMGILIKDAESLEKGIKIDTIILDKTGTITEGKPKVSHFITSEDCTELDRKAIFSLEKKSEHPLANAIAAYLSQENLEIKSFKSITGHGVQGIIEGDIYRVGNLKWIKSEGVTSNTELKNKAEKALEEGFIIVFASKNDHLIGFFMIGDLVKETSKEAITNLKHMGIEVHMLTGDQEKTAWLIAKSVDIEHYKSEMLPQDKAEYIKTLQSKGKKVGMVGDGINDSEALSIADLSIAMGHGTDIAMDIAEITLVHSDLNDIPKSLKLTKKSIKIIHQNLFWAFIYNIIGIPVAAGLLYPMFGFLLNPMIAGAAMALSSVSVVTNSLRLRK
ncbi:heavy metal translocating P-type ATPase [Belliella sp. R4-6]|uniref:Heavy metal translocating P-type ATPase n=1 Tax=Belliella alkalica TaxID=1730871 RepID=A0ABS9VAP8_9BACT|nr:heavy metal translocating P-type ATPase [Belliella alkalica]MCH7413504.1 heavy metal translocating P-type ATPase [Belliella alkalica]